MASMDSVQDAPVANMNKRSVNNDVLQSDCSTLVSPAGEKTPIDHETVVLPVEAARKRAKVESSHPPRFTAASAHDKGSRVDMEGNQ